MTRDLIRTAVTQCLAQLTGLPANRISDGDNLVEDLGVDSLVTVKFIGTVEEALGLPLPEGCDALLITARTVDQVVQRLYAAFDPRVEP